MHAAQRKIDEFRRLARVVEPFPDLQGYRLERPEESMTIRRRQGRDQPVGVYSRHDVHQSNLGIFRTTVQGEMLLPCRRGRPGSASVGRDRAA